MKKLVPSLVLTLLATVLWFNSSFLRSELQESRRQFSSYGVFPKALVQSASLGFVDFFEEMFFFGLIEDLGFKDREKVNKKLLTQKILSFATLSPRIEIFYTLSCFVLLFEFESSAPCLKILEEGRKALPLSWRLPLTQGYVHAFWLGSFEQAAKAYEAASFLEGAPSYLPGFAKKLARGTAPFVEKERAEEILFNRRDP